MPLNLFNLLNKLTEISSEDISLIMQARKILSFNEGIPWVKQEGNEDFDVPMGCIDGAEVCELVGSYILQQLIKLFKQLSIGVYRDDDLAILKGLSGSETDRVKKKVKSI